MFEFAAWAPAAVPLLAFGLDVVFGEPPVRLHPVVWMGQYLQWAGERIAPLVVVDAPPSRGARPANASRIAGKGESICQKRAEPRQFRMPVASSSGGLWPGCWALP